MSFLNQQHKFIYIHIPKTGGVALTRALYRAGLKNDLSFGMGPKSNQLTARILKRLPVVPVPKKPGIGRLKALELIFSGHLSVYDFSINVNDLSDYQLFTLVRNPFSWLVSLFTFVNSVRNHPYSNMHPTRFSTFEHFIQLQCKKPTSQLGYIRNSIGRTDGVTVFKLETISGHYAQLSDIIGATQIEMKNENSSRHRHYSQFYTPSLRDMVTRTYQSDLDELGYEFEYEQNSSA